MGSIAVETRSLVDIASRISSNTALLNKHLASKVLQTPTFDKDAEEDFHSLTDAPKIEAAREALLEDTNRLHDLVLGPANVLRRICWGSMNTSVLRAIYHFKIHEAIPLSGGSTYSEIATKVGLPEHRVKSIIRQAALDHVFAEDSPNHVVHTAASAILIRNKAMLDWVGHFTEEALPTSANLVDAMERYPGSEEPGESAFALAFNTQSIFKFFDENNDRQARFFGAMAGVGKSPGLSVQHILKGYGWVQLGKALVVDVGGSSGFVSTALANAYPDLEFEVQDLQHTIEKGAQDLAPELRSRVKFMAHDFFKPQPTTGDIYLMRHICHDWSSKYSAKILRAIVPAMKPSSRILMIESVMQAPGTLSQLQERTMSQERSREDWEDLVFQTDPKLEIKSIHRPAGSWDSMIEVGFKS
ncbi:O-methyltransferase bik3 [Lachnellula suecica]|uniref:O-methyltransferase bik3 n=1 Tax=Lachnellula suecica TaxID=602035 RepID=A0A8T9CBT9_9HELO|nr:O-methyltransferase bik3 [Lachnellula suecica]